MKSMTGFGRGKDESVYVTVTAEIKAVNSRFLEVNIRSDYFSPFIENQVNKTVRQTINRGKLNIFLTFVPSKSTQNYHVELDHPLLDAYVNALNEGKNIKGIQHKKILITDLLSSVPESFIHVQKQLINDDDLAPVVIKAVNNALEDLIQMREKEGENLKRDILKRIDFLQNKLQFLMSRQNSAVQEYENRLKEKIDKIFNERNFAVDEGRILEEVAIYAEKVDYTEEVVRFGSHLDQFREILNSDEPIGRKLDFLLQEINREVNTTASKASDIEVIDCVIIIKTELEKIREQVQNIE